MSIFNVVIGENRAIIYLI